MLDLLCLDLVKLIVVMGKESSSVYVGLQYVSNVFREYLIGSENRRNQFVDQLYTRRIDGKCTCHDLFGEYTVKDSRLKEIWSLYGKLHRNHVDLEGNDLPAVIYADGSKKWYRNGELHRDHVDSEGNDLPAVICANGDRAWYRNGQRHRDRVDSDGNDLPAVICANGDREWWQNGQHHRNRRRLRR